MLPCEFCEIYKKNYFVEHLRTASSVGISYAGQHYFARDKVGRDG